MKVVKPQTQSLTVEILKALVPYTRQNIKLVYKPHRFFNDLEKITTANRRTLATTMSRSKRQGLVEMKDGVPTLTAKGKARLSKLQTPDLLAGWLIVSFDIPEHRRKDRDTLRYFLKSRGFRQLHKSLWGSDQDYVQEVEDAIAELRLARYVAVFVAASVFAPGLK